MSVESRPISWEALSAALLIATALGAAGCAPTPPVAAPAEDVFVASGRYLVEGTGTATIKGLELAGTFELELLERGGEVTVQRFTTRLQDFDVVSRFLFFRRNRERFRCTEASNLAPLSGAVDPSRNLRLDPGAVMLGFAYEQRGEEGSCPGRGRYARFDGTSDREITGLHDPGRDLFRLHGSFDATFEGDSLDMELDLEGRYVNRPPVAVVGVDGPGYDLAQGGCPPLAGINPPAAEANDPEGLRLTLVSSAYDPDGRVRTDLATESWAHWQGEPGDPESPYRYLGSGRVVGPVLFPFSESEHFLRLEVTDRRLAQDRAGCRFRIADTTPPTVAAPVLTTVPCNSDNGARPRLSQELAQLLASSSAVDLADPAPQQLPTLLAGSEVEDETLFPPGRNVVTFRYRDTAGNVGAQDAAVEVGTDGACG